MKHKHLLYSLFAAASLITVSCDYNEDNFPGYDELAHPTDIGNDTLTLVSSDYKNIAKIDANINLATSKDPEGESYLRALEAVGNNGYFTEDAQIAWYMPAYLEQKFPYYDDGSKATIFYKEYTNLPDYLNDFNGIKKYSLTADDYQTVWGEDMTASFLTPATIRQMPNILATAISDAKEGDMRLVEYAFSETEPSTGGGSVEVSPIYLEAVIGDDDGGFQPQNITLEGVSYVWKYDSEHHYWKASAYVGGNKTAESWLLTPEVDLTAAKEPVFSADLILNHLNGAPMENHIAIKVSTDYAGDVKTATWETLEIPNKPTGNSWDEVNTGNIDLSAYKGQKIYIAFQYNSNTDAAPTWEVYNVYVQELEVATATKALASTRAVSEPNAAAVYRYDGSNWQAYSTDEADIAVLQPADYDQIGYTTIKTPGETLPIYLKQTYPYAQADDVVAVVYYNYDGGISATEFIYDGATWIETTVAQTSSIVFLKSGGEWQEAKVYYSATLLNGESGGFTVQDIELDGLSTIWTLDNSYGWKGSGYSNGGNKETESWLVSSEIDLSKAVAPVLKFDVAINFLNAKTVDDYFSVNVSTDYSGDATTATWDQLEITQWPEGNSWSFSTVEGIKLDAYVGQKIYLSFHYLSDSESAITVEIKNLSIQE